MRSDYGLELRKYLVTKTTPQTLIDFGETHVFESATVMTNILLFNKDNGTNNLRATQIEDDFTVVC